MKLFVRAGIFLSAIIFAGVIVFYPRVRPLATSTRLGRWKFQSIDTMKYSRDTSREKLADFRFDSVIDEQVGNIAQTGATHVAIATPYDEEFTPFMKRWVTAARKHNLRVWFRGNWSGWERWFGYSKITREEHIAKTVAFVLNHRELFADGDVFSSCPECENGGPGNPHITGDVRGHREFLITEYLAVKEAFARINKNVAANYFSMNGDVAKLIMDKPTTTALDGIVTIDHYVSTPKQLVDDIAFISRQSGGRVVLGEFGAPIPDIHGKMNADEQASYLGQTLRALLEAPELVGISYWTGTGGSTAIWTESGEPKVAVSVITKYFSPLTFAGKTVNSFAHPLSGVSVIGEDAAVTTDAGGNFLLPYFADRPRIVVRKSGYKDGTLNILDLENQPIVMTRNHFSWLESFFSFFKSLFKF